MEPVAQLLPLDPNANDSLPRDAATLAIPLDRPVTRLGRHRDNDVVVPDIMASRDHAQIRRTSQGFILEDLGSLNGTYVDGVRIAQPTRLIHGNRIRIVDSLFEFQQTANAVLPIDPTQEFDPQERRLKRTIDRLQTRTLTLERLVSELSLLHQAGLALGATIGVEQLLEVTRQQVGQIVDASNLMVALYEPERRALEVALTVEATITTSHRTAPRVDPADRIVELRQPLLIRSPDEARALGLVLPPGCQSCLGVPMISREELIGVILVESTRSAAFDSDDARVLTILAGQAGAALHNARLYARIAEQERVRQELQVAASIQRGLLPAQTPTLPGFEIAGKMEPATEIGGDFYSYVPVDGRRCFVAVGDVSGKGIPAALYMAIATSLLTAHAHASPDLATLLAGLNRDLHERMGDSRSNTALVLALIDTPRRQVRVANAGLISPILLRGNEPPIFLPVEGLPLGIVPDMDYDELLISLQPGDTIVLCSDGTIEAMNRRREFFGFDRVAETLSAGRHRPAAAQVRDLELAMRRFVGKADQHDDYTIVAIRATPS